MKSSFYSGNHRKCLGLDFVYCVFSQLFSLYPFLFFHQVLLFSLHIRFHFPQKPCGCVLDRHRHNIAPRAVIWPLFWLPHIPEIRRRWYWALKVMWSGQDLYAGMTFLLFGFECEHMMICQVSLSLKRHQDILICTLHKKLTTLALCGFPCNKLWWRGFVSLV